MLRTQTKYYWKYIPNFKRKEKRFTQLKTEDQTVTASKTLADTSATALNTVIISPTFNSHFAISDRLFLSPFSADEVSRATRHLKQSKSVGSGGITCYIKEGSSLFFLLC